MPFPAGKLTTEVPGMNVTVQWWCLMMGQNGIGVKDVVMTRIAKGVPLMARTRHSQTRNDSISLS